MRKFLSEFEDYHQGAINIIIHDIGFALWGLGVGLQNVPLVIIAPLVFESGHLYNYLTGRRTKHDIKMIPGQIGMWIVFAGLGLLLIHLLRNAS
jgi:hypothetical protein